jgi:hypothetical protein
MGKKDKRSRVESAIDNEEVETQVIEEPEAIEDNVDNNDVELKKKKKSKKNKKQKRAEEEETEDVEVQEQQQVTEELMEESTSTVVKKKKTKHLTSSTETLSTTSAFVSYIPHEDVLRLTASEVSALREELDIHVYPPTASEAYAPMPAFKHLKPSLSK